MLNFLENVEIIGKKIIKDYILAFNNRDNYEMANLFIK